MKTKKVIIEIDEDGDIIDHEGVCIGTIELYFVDSVFDKLSEYEPSATESLLDFMSQNHAELAKELHAEPIFKYKKHEGKVMRDDPWSSARVDELSAADVDKGYRPSDNPGEFKVTGKLSFDTDSIARLDEVFEEAESFLEMSGILSPEIKDRANLDTVIELSKQGFDVDSIIALFDAEVL